MSTKHNKVMKIYVVINNAGQFLGTTMDKRIAVNYAAKYSNEKEKITAYEADIATQGKNIDTWAKNWKKIEIK